MDLGTEPTSTVQPFRGENGNAVLQLLVGRWCGLSRRFASLRSLHYLDRMEMLRYLLRTVLEVLR